MKHYSSFYKNRKACSDRDSSHTTIIIIPFFKFRRKLLLMMIGR